MKPELVDLKKIENVVKAVEMRTAGEIVPVIYDKCNNTSFVLPSLWLLIWFLLFSVQEWIWPLNFWDGYWLFQVLIPIALSGLIASLLARTNSGQRKFLPKYRREKAVRERAELEFYRRGLAGTKERIGIILFVSLMERYSVVLADEAINKKLPPDTWREILNILNSKLSYKNLSEGFVPAIEKCGEILSKYFPRDSQDTNELPDYPIFRSYYD